MAGIVNRNIRAKYRLDFPVSKWPMPPKVFENDQAKILWDFKIQVDKMVVIYQVDIVDIDDIHDRKAVVVDVAITSDSNIREKGTQEAGQYMGSGQ